MKKLSEILYNVHILALYGNTDVSIESIQLDSRLIMPGSLFIAVNGTHSDGHLYIESAVEKGARAIVCEVVPAERDSTCTYIQVSQSSEAVGRIANNFYDQPSQKLHLVGVTGTNGKTTIATLLYKLFTGLGYKTGLISTVENRIGNRVLTATHTTPDPITLNELLYQMVSEGCSHAFMEASSHAIDQRRIAGLHFAGGIFSNITHDHLDYHKTFDAYIKAKKKFFDSLPTSSFALTNIDDKRGNIMLQNTSARKYTYSLLSPATFKGKILENGITGLVMTINEQEVHFRLIGEFNAYNLLAVYGSAICLGENKDRVLASLSNLTGAEGRFDYILSQKEKVMGIVDYAHTPDALLNVLATIKKLRQGHEKIITVIGCGGDRDKTKRPIMADVACEFSDHAIFTSDNPRSEDAETIIKDMESGLKVSAKRKYVSVTDRREAIKLAVSMARPEDIILVAGKGHEKYQDIKGVKYHFDDKEVVSQMFQLLDK